MCWLILQYPQTGRTSGNCPTLVIPTSWSRSCSTLRRVEPHATQQEAAWTYRVNRLAVPSDGSNLRQLTAQHIDDIVIRPCSTLRRVEPQATYHNRLVSHRLHLLQYPQTGRTSGNILLLPDNTAALRLAVPSDGSNLMQPPFGQVPTIKRPHLQYPQTGRTSCNRKRPTANLHD